MHFPLKFFIHRYTLYIFSMYYVRTCVGGEADADEVRVKNMRLKESDAYRFKRYDAPAGAVSYCVRTGRTVKP